MPTDVLDQIRRLGTAFDEFIDDVRLDEIVERSSVTPPRRRGPATPLGRVDQRSPNRRRIAVAAATVVLVVVLVGGLWWWAQLDEMAPSDTPPRPSPTSPDATIDPATLATIPPEVIPSSATFRVAVGTPIGEFQIYDHPDAAQTCLYLRTVDSSTGGCEDNTNIQAGRSSTLIGGVHETRRLVWGLAPDSGDFSVTIGNRTITPDENGLWYAALDDDINEFTLNTPTGPLTINASP